LIINSSISGNYNEGIRITRAGNSWAGITFGSTGDSGAPSGGWFVATNPSNQFILNPDDSGNTAGLTLNKGGDLKWRNNTVITSKNIGSQNVNSSTYASSYLASRQTIGSSTHATSLQDYFNNYKSSIPRNCLTANYSSAYGNGSLYFGYFLSGYDSTPYGGFYVCHYNNPYYVGISNGSYNQQEIITSSSIGSQSVNYAASAGAVAWGNVTGKPSTFTPSSHSHDYLYTTQVSQPQDATYGSSMVSWAQGFAASYPKSFVYNTYGAEFSYLNGMNTNNSYGTILKMGYSDTYLRILRKSGGNWYTSDWEKISAGYADSAGNADTVDSEHSSAFAHRQYWNDMVHSGNEYTWIRGGYSGGVWINYRTASGGCDGNITEYIFGNGKGGSLASITSGTFNGNCTGSAGSVAWSNVTGKPDVLTNPYSGKFTINGGSERATLYLITSTNQPNDLYFGSNGSAHWSITSRESSDPFMGLYNARRGDWAYTISTWDNSITFSSAVYSNSDRKLKKNIQSIPESSLDDLFDVSDKLLKKFTWKSTGKDSYGFIAQQLEQYIPEAVSIDANDIKSVSYDIAYAKIIASIIYKIKELEKEIVEIKNGKMSN